MRRRDLIAGLLVGTAIPFASSAQQQRAKVFRIGYLGYSAPEQYLVEAFRQGLRDLGYLEGQNVTVESLSAEGKIERLRELAAALVERNVDVIVTLATPGALAAKQATNTIPIVVAAMADPVRDGLVGSLARPGGNITGATFLGPELIPKRLGLLKEAIPTASRVAVLWHPGVYGEHTMEDMLKETEIAARALGVQLQMMGAAGPDDFDAAFSSMRRERVDALVVFPSPMIYLEHRRIVDLAAKSRLPTIYPWREGADAGGLMAYGPNIPDTLRHAAVLVDKILKGAKPAELPIEQPTEFELVINLKAAKALGLTIPQSLLLHADELID